MNARLIDSVELEQLSFNGKHRPHRTSIRKDQRKDAPRRKLIRAGLGLVKAWGFTVLLEGTMIFSHTEPLRLSGMVLLVVINAAYGFRQARKHTV